MSSRVHNFSAGPSTLPLEVLEEAQQELVDYRGSGMSLVEMSHRGQHYDAVHTEALALVREVFEVPDEFDVLFIQGGATLQFSMVPANLLSFDERGAYVVSGSWASKAVADGRHHGDVYRAWDGAADGYTRMPSTEEIDLRPGTRYLHITSNETIEGIRFTDWPEVDVPLVADMSSDLASRPIAWDRFDLVYGGVQKNLGPAGMAMVFVRSAAIADANDGLGAYLRYAVHAKKDSMYNTPPVFTVWLVGKVLRWIRSHGALEGMREAAERKSALLYETIEASDGYYTNPVDPGSRSVMNVVFRLPTPDLEAAFLAEAADHGLVNLKGHRSVGGCRASIYNAMPDEGVRALSDFMTAFRDGHAA